MDELNDYHCPECGAELSFWGNEGHELNDGDYWTPPTYEIDCYVYKCPVCGEIYKTQNAL